MSIAEGLLFEEWAAGYGSPYLIDDDASSDDATFVEPVEPFALTPKAKPATRLAFVDGPIYNIRTLDQPVVGYVKTHLRRRLRLDLHARAPDLAAGQRIPLSSPARAIPPKGYAPRRPAKRPPRRVGWSNGRCRGSRS
jgi:hypothetical protein